MMISMGKLIKCTRNALVSYFGTLVPIVVMLCACSSTVERGDVLLQSGLNEDAADLYSAALAEDPNDVNARIGLSNARHQIIDRGLIQVRMLRLSANMSAALPKLEQILRNQRQWNLQLQPAVAMSQNEELRYAKAWILNEAEQIAASAYPDRFRWFEYEYKQLIANAQIESEFDAYRARVNLAGINKCIVVSQAVEHQQAYLRRFVERYCGHWGHQAEFQFEITPVSYDSASDSMPPSNAGGLLSKLTSTVSGVAESILGRLNPQKQDKSTCHFDPTKMVDTLAENIMRCAFSDPDNAYINSWFRDEYGISYRQMLDLFELGVSKP